jgi:hypothetical protein
VTRGPGVAWAVVGVVLVAGLALGGGAVAQSADGTLTVRGDLDVSAGTPAPPTAGSPFDAPLPGVGAVGVPTDPDGDGRYEDVDGDGERTLDDVFAFAFGPLQRADALSDAQRRALDFDGDGTLTLDDAFALAFAE